MENAKKLITVDDVECGRCRDCPFIQDFLGKIINIRESKRNLTDFAMSDNVDEMAEAIFDRMPAGIKYFGSDGELNEIESVDDLALGIRSGSANFLDWLDMNETYIKNDIEDLTDGCDGQMKMRAERAGKVATVTVCMSPFKFDGETKEQIQINRQTKN